MDCVYQDVEGQIKISQQAECSCGCGAVRSSGVVALYHLPNKRVWTVDGIVKNMYEFASEKFDPNDFCSCFGVVSEKIFPEGTTEVFDSIFQTKIPEGTQFARCGEKESWTVETYEELFNKIGSEEDQIIYKGRKINNYPVEKGAIKIDVATDSTFVICHVTMLSVYTDLFKAGYIKPSMSQRRVIVSGGKSGEIYFTEGDSVRDFLISIITSFEPFDFQMPESVDTSKVATLEKIEDEIFNIILCVGFVDISISNYLKMLFVEWYTDDFISKESSVCPSLVKDFDYLLPVSKFVDVICSASACDRDDPPHKWSNEDAKKWCESVGLKCPTENISGRFLLTLNGQAIDMFWGNPDKIDCFDALWRHYNPRE